MEKPNFYTRMQEAKKRKKLRLEQEQLEAEFLGEPDHFVSPDPSLPVKTQAEQKLDAAFQQLQAKLRQENPTPQDKLNAAFDELARKAQGL